MDEASLGMSSPLSGPTGAYGRQPAYGQQPSQEQSPYGQQPSQEQPGYGGQPSQPGSRASPCGSISGYNDEKPRPGPRNLFLIVTKRLRMEGYIISDHYDRFPEFLERAQEWVRDGRLRYRETIVEGIENAPSAFLGLLRGENIGKMLVKVGPSEP